MATTFPPKSKCVAFKSVSGKYLLPRKIGTDSRYFLKFEKEERDDTMRFELTEQPDVENILSIKSHFYANTFWKRDVPSNWIVLTDAPDGKLNPDVLFKYILDKANNVVILQNDGNSKFCVRDSEGEIQDCLKAVGLTSEQAARLVWEEFPPPGQVDN